MPQTHQVTLLLIALSSLLFPISGVMAQTKVTPIPSNLTVLGTRCVLPQLGCEAIARNLLLRSDRGMTNLQIYSLDLNRADGAAVFPAQAIRPTISQNSLQPNQPLTIPIQFDLDKTPSGEYNGAILLSYTEGELTIPMAIRVKDHPLAPFFVLLLGVGLGIGISSYRTEGMARDEILVRVGRLRVQMQADPQLDISFERQISNYLIDVDTALEAKRWEMAQQAIDRAIGIWDKWRKDRQEWVVQIQYRQELATRLPAEMAVTVDSFYLLSMRRQLEDLTRKTVDLTSPLQLRDALDDLQQQFNRYLQGRSKLEKLKQLAIELPLEQQITGQSRIQQFQLSLDSLSPQKSDLFATWQKSVDGAISEWMQILEKQKPLENGSGTSLTKNSAIVFPFLAPVPEVRPPADLIEMARRRLLWFNWLSYAIAVGLLSGTGFVQLYVTKPTFGANGLGDYFVLMAWGFGAEVTRDSVTKVVRDWKLPGMK
jgi:hypothetical protein